jgi:hypothetical protein
MNLVVCLENFDFFSLFDAYKPPVLNGGFLMQD